MFPKLWSLPEATEAREKDILFKLRRNETEPVIRTFLNCFFNFVVLKKNYYCFKTGGNDRYAIYSRNCISFHRSKPCFIVVFYSQLTRGCVIHITLGAAFPCLFTLYVTSADILFLFVLFIQCESSFCIVNICFD